jgi:hypothetical protein
MRVTPTSLLLKSTSELMGGSLPIRIQPLDWLNLGSLSSISFQYPKNDYSGAQISLSKEAGGVFRAGYAEIPCKTCVTLDKYARS